MTEASNNGITGAVNANLPVLMTMVAFSTMALYNVLELNVIIFATFQRRQGLYFWSFVVATWGIAPHTVGFIFKFFDVTSIWWLPVTLVAIGWFGMVTGQSLLLYSRLNLVVRDEHRIRWVLYLIIFDAIAIGIPDMILAFLTNRPNANPAVVNAFIMFDRAQVGMFFVQESIISALYIYETVRLLGQDRGVHGDPLRKLLTHLIFVNILVLIFDATLLGTEYSGNFQIQTTYKSAIYSIKLKIEFSVLNQLVNFVKNNGLTAPYVLSERQGTSTHALTTFNNSASSNPCAYSSSVTGFDKGATQATVTLTEGSNN